MMLKVSARFFICFFLFIVISISQLQAQTNIPLKINVFSVSNGVGLERDRKILKKALEDLGHIVYEREVKTDQPNGNAADINIFFEIISPYWISSARLNWFIPNPEYYEQGDLYKKMDLILCRTREVERIFRSLNHPTYFLGFTSISRYDNKIDKNFSTFLHLAGSSLTKNTPIVVNLWKNHVDLPNLVMIKHLGGPELSQPNVHWISSHLPEDDLTHLQNACGIHLCPSIAEGYGHYIMEAMAAGAVVITTDAPPMNEFITDRRCLIPYSSSCPRHFGTAYFVDAQHVASTIRAIQELPVDELEKIGQQNRSVYLQNTRTFHQNLKLLLESLQQQNGTK